MSYSTDEAIMLAGGTYKQADHYVRKGYVQLAKHANGPGTQRSWRPRDVVALAVLLRLSAVGFGGHASSLGEWSPLIYRELDKGLADRFYFERGSVSVRVDVQGLGTRLKDAEGI